MAFLMMSPAPIERWRKGDSNLNWIGDLDVLLGVWIKECHGLILSPSASEFSALLSSSSLYHSGSPNVLCLRIWGHAHFQSDSRISSRHSFSMSTTTSFRSGPISRGESCKSPRSRRCWTDLCPPGGSSDAGRDCLYHVGRRRILLLPLHAVDFFEGLRDELSHQAFLVWPE